MSARFDHARGAGAGAADKDRAVSRLQELEREARDRAAIAKAGRDEASRRVESARAAAFSTAIDVVQGVAF